LQSFLLLEHIKSQAEKRRGDNRNEEASKQVE